MSPARDYVTEVLGFDPENASPTSVVSGERFLAKLGLGGCFWPAGQTRAELRQGGLAWHRKLYYKNRVAQGEDPWASAVVLAAEEDSWRHGEKANVTLQAAAALILARGDAWLVWGAS